MNDQTILTVAELDQYLETLTGSVDYENNEVIIALKQAIEAYDHYRGTDTFNEYYSAERIREITVNAAFLPSDMVNSIGRQVYNTQGRILSSMEFSGEASTLLTLPNLDAALRLEVPLAAAPGGPMNDRIQALRELVLDIQRNQGTHRLYMLHEQLRREAHRYTVFFAPGDNDVGSRLAQATAAQMTQIRTETTAFSHSEATPLPTLAQLDLALTEELDTPLSSLFDNPEIQALRDTIYQYHLNPPADVLARYVAYDEIKLRARQALDAHPDLDTGIVDSLLDETHDTQQQILADHATTVGDWTDIPNIIAFDAAIAALPPDQRNAEELAEVREALMEYETYRGDADADEYLAADTVWQALTNGNLEKQPWGHALVGIVNDRSREIVEERLETMLPLNEVTLLAVDAMGYTLSEGLYNSDAFAQLRTMVREFESDPGLDRAGSYYRLSQIQEKLSAIYHDAALAKTQDDRTTLYDYYQAVAGTRASVMDVVPENLHFLWLGKLGQIQVEYMDLWVGKNPEYNVSIWYDENAVLSHELARQIKTRAYAVAFDPSLSKAANQKRISELVLTWQNEAHTYIMEQIGQNRTFDQAAADFMVQRLEMDRDSVAQIRQNNIDSYTEGVRYLNARHHSGAVVLKDISQLWGDADAMKAHYLKELSLRGNLAAASDIARIRVLEREGGVYVDADLLPQMADIFTHEETEIIQTMRDNYVEARIEEGIRIGKFTRGDSKAVKYNIEWSQRYFQGMISQMVLDVWARDNMPARNALAHPQDGRDPGYLDYQKLILGTMQGDMVFSAGLATIRQRIRSTPPAELYDSLGELRIAPGTIYGGITPRDILGNGFLAARSDSPYLREWERVINGNYHLIEQSGADGIHSPDEIPGILERMNMPDLKGDYTAIEITRLGAYRMDGLRQSGIATAHVSGPNALTQVFSNLDRRHFQMPLTDTDSPSVDQSALGTPQHFTRYTEEDAKHSWIGSADERPRALYTDVMRYDHQLIVRLGDDHAVVQAANFLYNKHAGRSGIVTVDPDNPGRLKLIAGKFPVGGLPPNSRIIVVGHGTGSGEDYQLGGLNVHQVEALLRGSIQGKTADIPLIQRPQGLQRISLVSCNETDHLGNPTGEVFGRELLQLLWDSGRPVHDGISVRNGLVQVDAEGRKWVGSYDTGGSLVWSNKGDGHKTVIRMGENGPEAQRVNIERGNVVKQLSLEYASGILNGGRLGLFDPISTSTNTRLSSTVAPTETTIRLQRYAKEGNILTVANLEAILLALSDGNHTISVMDDSAEDLAGIQKAIQMAQVSSSMDEWLSTIALFYGPSTRALKAAMKELKGTLSFDNLKRRIGSNNIDFYLLDSGNADAYGVFRAANKERYRAIYTAEGEMGHHIETHDQEVVPVETVLSQLSSTPRSVFVAPVMAPGGLTPAQADELVAQYVADRMDAEEFLTWYTTQIEAIYLDKELSRASDVFLKEDFKPSEAVPPGVRIKYLYTAIQEGQLAHAELVWLTTYESVRAGATSQVPDHALQLLRMLSGGEAIHGGEAYDQMLARLDGETGRLGILLKQLDITAPEETLIAETEWVTHTLDRIGHPPADKLTGTQVETIIANAVGGMLNLKWLKAWKNQILALDAQGELSKPSSDYVKTLDFNDPQPLSMAERIEYFKATLATEYFEQAQRVWRGLYVSVDDGDLRPDDLLEPLFDHIIATEGTPKASMADYFIKTRPRSETLLFSFNGAERLIRELDEVPNLEWAFLKKLASTQVLNGVKRMLAIEGWSPKGGPAMLIPLKATLSPANRVLAAWGEVANRLGVSLMASEEGNIEAANAAVADAYDFYQKNVLALEPAPVLRAKQLVPKELANQHAELLMHKSTLIWNAESIQGLLTPENHQLLSELMRQAIQAARFEDLETVFFDRTRNTLETISGSVELIGNSGRKSIDGSDAYQWKPGESLPGFKVLATGFSRGLAFRYTRIAQNKGTLLLPDEFTLTASGLPVVDLKAHLLNIFGEDVTQPRAIFIQDDTNFTVEDFIALQTTLTKDIIFMPLSMSNIEAHFTHTRLSQLLGAKEISKLPVFVNAPGLKKQIESTANLIAQGIPEALLKDIYFTKAQVNTPFLQRFQKGLRNAYAQQVPAPKDMPTSLTIHGAKGLTSVLPDQASVWMHDQHIAVSIEDMLDQPTQVFTPEHGFTQGNIDLTQPPVKSDPLAEMVEPSLVGIEDEYLLLVFQENNPTIYDDIGAGSVLAKSRDIGEAAFPPIQFTIDWIQKGEPYIEVVYAPQSITRWGSGEIDATRAAFADAMRTLGSKDPSVVNNVSLVDFVEAYNQSVTERLGSRAAPWLVQVARGFRPLQISYYTKPEWFERRTQVSLQIPLDAILTPKYVDMAVSITDTQPEGKQEVVRGIVEAAQTAGKEALKAAEFQGLEVTTEFKAFLTLMFMRVYERFAYSLVLKGDNKLNYRSILRTSAVDVMYETLTNRQLGQVVQWLERTSGKASFTKLLSNYLPPSVDRLSFVMEKQVVTHMTDALINVAVARLSNPNYQLYTKLPDSSTPGYDDSYILILADAIRQWHVYPEALISLTRINGKTYTVMELRNIGRLKGITGEAFLKDEDPVIRQIRRIQGIPEPGLGIFAGLGALKLVPLMDAGLYNGVKSLVTVARNTALSQEERQGEALRFIAQLKEVTQQAYQVGNERLLNVLVPLSANGRWTRFFSELGLMTPEASTRLNHLLSVEWAFSKEKVYRALVNQITEYDGYGIPEGQVPTEHDFADALKVLAEEYHGRSLAKAIKPLVTGYIEGGIDLETFAQVVAGAAWAGNPVNRSIIAALKRHKEIDLDKIAGRLKDNQILHGQFLDVIGQLDASGPQTPEHTGNGQKQGPAGTAADTAGDAPAFTTTPLNLSSRSVVARAEMEAIMGRLNPMAAQHGLIGDVKKIYEAVDEKLDEHLTDAAGNDFRIGDKYQLDEGSARFEDGRLLYRLVLKEIDGLPNIDPNLPQHIDYDLETEPLNLKSRALVEKHQQQIAMVQHELDNDTPLADTGSSASKAATRSRAARYGERAVTVGNTALAAIGILQTARAIEDGNADFASYLSGGSIALFSGSHALQGGLRLATRLAKSLAPEAKALLANAQKALATTVAKVTGTSVEAAEAGTKVALSAGVATADAAEAGVHIAASTVGRLMAQAIPYVGIVIGLAFLALDTVHMVEAFSEGNIVEGVGALGDVGFDIANVVVDTIGSALGPEAAPIVAAVSFFINLGRLIWDSSIGEIGMQIDKLGPHADAGDYLKAIGLGIAYGLRDIVKNLTPWGAIEQTKHLKQQHQDNLDFLAQLNDPENYFTIRTQDDGHEVIDFIAAPTASYGGNLVFTLGEPGELSYLTIGEVPEDVLNYRGNINTHDLLWHHRLDPSLNTVVLGFGENHILHATKEKAYYAWAIPVHTEVVLDGDIPDESSLKATYRGNSQDNTLYGARLEGYASEQDYNNDGTIDQKDHEIRGARAMNMVNYKLNVYAGGGNDQIILGDSNYRVEGGEGADVYVVSTLDPNDNYLRHYYGTSEFYDGPKKWRNSNYATAHDYEEVLTPWTRTNKSVHLEKIIQNHAVDGQTDTIFLDRTLGQIALVRGNAVGTHRKDVSFGMGERNYERLNVGTSAEEMNFFSDVENDNLYIYLLENDFRSGHNGLNDLIGIVSAWYNYSQFNPSFRDGISPWSANLYNPNRTTLEQLNQYIQTDQALWAALNDSENYDHILIDRLSKQQQREIASLTAFYYAYSKHDLVLEDYFKDESHRHIQLRTKDGYVLEISPDRTKGRASDFYDRSATSRVPEGSTPDTDRYRVQTTEIVAYYMPEGDDGPDNPDFDASTYATLKTLVGEGRANTLTGNALDNQIWGRGGNDTLIGGAGNDLLDGGGGIDHLTGGDGADTYLFGYDNFYVLTNEGENVLPTGNRLDSGGQVGLAHAQVDRIDNRATDNAEDIIHISARLEQIGTALYNNTLYFGFKQDESAANDPNRDHILAIGGISHWDDESSRSIFLVTSDGYTLSLDETGQYTVTGFDGAGYLEQYQPGHVSHVQVGIKPSPIPPAGEFGAPLPPDFTGGIQWQATGYGSGGFGVEGGLAATLYGTDAQGDHQALATLERGAVNTKTDFPDGFTNGTPSRLVYTGSLYIGNEGAQHFKVTSTGGFSIFLDGEETPSFHFDASVLPEGVTQEEIDQHLLGEGNPVHFSQEIQFSAGFHQIRIEFDLTQGEITDLRQVQLQNRSAAPVNLNEITVADLAEIRGVGELLVDGKNIGISFDAEAQGFTGLGRIAGTDNDDRLKGDAGDNVFDGGSGRNYLEGGSGADVYLTGSADSGVDVINNVDTVGDLELDTIVVDATLQELNFYAVGAQGPVNLVIRKETTDNTVTDLAVVKNFFAGDQTRHFQIKTSDGHLVTPEHENLPLFPWTSGTGTESYVLYKVTGEQHSDSTEDLIIDATQAGREDYIRLVGGSGNDILTGNANDNLLSGGDGDDHLIGGAGDDQFVGARGNDTFEGGPGQDTFRILADNSQDVIDDAANGDETDMVVLDTPFDQIETRRAGNDLIVSGGGTWVRMAQWYAADSRQNYAFVTQDRVQFSVDENADVIIHSVDYQDRQGGINLNLNDGEILSSAALIYGSENSDTVVGNAGDNTFAGRGGTDDFTGGDGHDTLFLSQGDGQAIFRTLSNDHATDIVSFQFDHTHLQETLRSDTSLIVQTDQNTSVFILNWFQDARVRHVQVHTTDVIYEIQDDGSLAPVHFLANTGNDGFLNLGRVGNELATSATGDAHADEFVGNDLDNILEGKGGADRLSGGDGADVYLLQTGDVTADEVVINNQADDGKQDTLVLSRTDFDQIRLTRANRDLIIHTPEHNVRMVDFFLNDRYRHLSLTSRDGVSARVGIHSVDGTNQARLILSAYDDSGRFGVTRDLGQGVQRTVLSIQDSGGDDHYTGNLADNAFTSTGGSDYLAGGIGKDVYQIQATQTGRTITLDITDSQDSIVINADFIDFGEGFPEGNDFVLPVGRDRIRLANWRNRDLSVAIQSRDGYGFTMDKDGVLTLVARDFSKQSPLGQGGLLGVTYSALDDAANKAGGIGILGTAQLDTLTGDNGDNTISGNGGNDRFTGLDGTDTYIVSGTDHTVIDNTATDGAMDSLVIPYKFDQLTIERRNQDLWIGHSQVAHFSVRVENYFTDAGHRHLYIADISQSIYLIESNADIQVSTSRMEAVEVKTFDVKSRPQILEILNNSDIDNGDPGSRRDGDDLMVRVHSYDVARLTDFYAEDTVFQPFFVLKDNRVWEVAQDGEVIEQAAGDLAYVAALAAPLTTPLVVQTSGEGLDLDLSAPENIGISQVTGSKTQANRVYNSGIPGSTAYQISGGDADDTLEGGDGADQIQGHGGNDLIFAHGGDDQLSGGSDNDRIFGGAGDDLITGGSGTDVLDGGDGTDTVFFTGDLFHQTGVDVYLDRGYGFGSDAAGDRFTNFENLIGSEFDDTLQGTNQINIILGQGGDDHLLGLGGNDTLTGGDGDNILDGGDGLDLADYSLSSAGITADLAAGTATHATGTDTLISIESLTGSQYADVLKGDEGDNEFVGSLGGDTIQGRGGVDTVDYSAIQADTGWIFDGGNVLAPIHLSLGFSLGQGQEQVGDRVSSLAGLNGYQGLDGEFILLSGLTRDIRVARLINDEYHVIGSRLDDHHLVLTPEEYAGGYLLLGWAFHGELNIQAVGVDNFALASTLALGTFQDVSLSGIETITGSQAHDLILGDDSDNVLDGSLGWDHISGGGGNDRIIGRLENEYLDGGDGMDVVDYRNLNSRIFVDLNQNAGVLINETAPWYPKDLAEHLDWTTKDTLIGFESVLGGSGDDILIGDDNDNRLVGNDGNDFFVVTGGSDSILGGDGMDIISYRDHELSLYVDLGYGQVVLGADEVDLFTGIEGVQGGRSDDILVGREDADDLFIASFGNDHLDGKGGLGTDRASYELFTATQAGSGLHLTSEFQILPGDISLSMDNLAANEFARIHLGDTVIPGTQYIITIAGVESRYVVPKTTETLAEVHAGLAQWLNEFSDLPDGIHASTQTDTETQAPYISIHGGNLVVNGGFENHDPIPLGNDEFAHIGVPGWNSQAGWGVMAGSETDTTAPSGSGQIQLDDGINLKIHQDLDTRAGAFYTLSLAYSSGDFETGHYSNDVEVWWNGNRVAILRGTDAQWDKYEYTVQATDEITRLEFRGVGDANGSGGLIDLVDVSLDQDHAANAPFLPKITVDSRLVGEGDSQRTITWTDGTGNTHTQSLTGIEAVHGTLADDHMEGWEGSDIFHGSEGNDHLYGYLGDDVLDGGAGDDSLFGEGGNDIIIASLGSDTLDGGEGIDLVEFSNAAILSVDAYLEEGIAKIHYLDNDDNMAMETQILKGFEEILGSAGDDRLQGDDQANLIIGGDGHDQIAGNGGNDELLGGDGNDRIAGNTGNDLIVGGAGADFLFGEDGDDILVADFEDFTIDGGEGTDTLDLSTIGIGVVASLTSDTFKALGIESSPVQAFTGIEALIGTEFSDLIQGSDHVDFIAGGDGNDWIWAGRNNDVLEGGDGFDVVDYSGYNKGVTIDLEQGIAEKPLYVSAGHSRDLLTGIEGFVGTAHTDHVTGDSGNNLIVATLGNDVIDLGWGVDGVDYRSITPTGNFLADLEAGTVTWTDGDGNTHSQTLSGVEHLAGSQGGDTLSGTDGRDLLAGWTGDDILTSLDGGDHLSGGLGDDTLTGGGGNDHYYYGLGDGNDTLNAGEAEDVDTGLDTIHLGPGIAFDNLNFIRTESNHRLEITDNNGTPLGSLTLEGFDNTSLRLEVRDENNQARLYELTLSDDGFTADAVDGEAYTVSEFTRTMDEFGGSAAQEVDLLTQAMARFQAESGDDGAGMMESAQPEPLSLAATLAP